MNDNELRLFGLSLLNKSIEYYIDNHTDEFEKLYNSFRELTAQDKDGMHWHSDIDVYIKNRNLDIKNPNLIGKSQLKYLKENTNKSENNIVLNLYSLQYFFEYGAEFYNQKSKQNVG